MITCKQIIDKFCEGPAAVYAPEMIPDCRECTTLQDLIATVNNHMDMRNAAQAALFVLNFLDYEVD